MEEKSFKEQRIRNVTHLYYSRPEIQKVLFDFAKNREISPRYFEGFGKRPDSFVYKDDVFSLVKKGATSFHCSEEIWEDPLKIETGMNEKQLNDLRIGWDLLIDIDCKWIDYSKLAAQAIISSLKNHGLKNVGIKFSGSKGFHILIPWKSFPKEMNGEDTKNLFPDLPRKIIAYIRYKSEQELKKILPDEFYSQFKNVEIKRGIKCRKCNEVVNAYEKIELYCDSCGIGEIRKFQGDKKNKYKCPNCRRELVPKNSSEIYECLKCNISSEKNPENFTKSIEVDLYELMGLDIILVSPRHLFRMPYSLHEKTSLSSVVLNPEKINEFELKDADPMKVGVKDFMPDVKEGEANELVMQALDWSKENEISRGEIEQKTSGKYADFKPIELKNVSDEQFPPCVLNILKGVSDGKKRAVFILINLFRSIGMDKEEMEKRIYEWNEKNEVPLKKGYILSQLSWSYRKKPIMPQNCKEFYQGIGVCQPDDFCGRIKNPVNYVVRKNFIEGKKSENEKKNSGRKKDNFKKKK
jgi:DNA primase catalytic subunit